MKQKLYGLAMGVSLLVSAATAGAADWPMWRHDATRSASSAESLPADLELQWAREFSPRVQVWDDPLNLDLMPYDRVFEPIVVGGRMFLGFNDRDKLTALDVQTGKELWNYFTGGPVRLPPVAWGENVYFCSDDGFLYCVAAATGQLQWRFQGGPSSRKVIGNRRVISAWPARGGPVVRDGQVYFAASIWPFMGTFIYAMDAATGTVIWVNDATGSQYIKQPHSAPSFGGVAPQGALVATEELLLVPGGRSVPAAFDRSTGAFRYFHINAGGKGTGGSFLAADDSRFYVHTRIKGVRAFDLQTGVKTAIQINEPVLAGDRIYSAELDGRQPVIRAYDADDKVLWQLEADGRGDLIRAGQRLYAAGPQGVTAIRLPQDGRSAAVVWSRQIDGSVARLLAASGKLIAVTLDGRILAFGAEPRTPQEIAEAPHPLTPTPDADRRARQLLAAGDTEGYAFWFGASDEDLLEAVVARSPFVELVVADEDADRVQRLRKRFDRAGVYGKVTVHRGSPLAFSAPPYVAHRVFVDAAVAADATENPDLLRRLFAPVRPYGGVLHLAAADRATAGLAQRIAEAKLENAELARSPQGLFVRRLGQLPGAADWTHQHGDVANTVKSDDRRVKVPLGLLWFGGNSHLDVLPRHGHGPPEQVVGGRLFIQGINSLTARDVYTGRTLWKREFQDLGTFDVYFDASFRDTPLDPSYNQLHIPGANARGTNYVATADRVYIVEGSVCHVLDPASGELVQDIPLPESANSDGSEPPQWGYVGVYRDILIGGVGFASYRQRHQLSFADSDAKLRRSRAGFGAKSLDRSASQGLVAFDRHTGEVLWKMEARHSFWHNGIVAGGGRIYCLDKNPQPVEDALRRRGKALPGTYRIVCVDARTGELVWENAEGVFGTWLGYSEQFDFLLQAGAANKDRLTAEVGSGMAVYRGRDGKLQWKEEALEYAGPCILHNDLIFTNAGSYRASAGAFSLLTGEPKMVENPLTGAPQRWTISRAYGCNNVIASEHLLTFRSGAAGYYDMLGESGTGNLGGFKSGCTSNLVVADGVLNAPDYTRSCSCAYQNQTSLALVHMPELDTEMWAMTSASQLNPQQKRIQKLGINFGAPGDRRAEDDILWLEYPDQSVDEFPVTMEIEGDPNYFRRHATSVGTAALPWVQSSGVANARRIRIAVGAQVRSNSERPATYRVRLFFGDPLQSTPGDRAFDVWLQGRQVLQDFDIVAEAEGGSRALVKQFDDIPIDDWLEITFAAKHGTPILSGVELLRTPHSTEPQPSQHLP